MYRGAAGGREDDYSSDDSPLYNKNFPVKLKDLSDPLKTRPLSSTSIPIERHQLGDPADLSLALEREKVKSILAKGNAKNKRRPPPPPVAGQQGQGEIPYRNMNITHSTPQPSSAILRHLEQVDDSPLTSPENIRLTRLGG